MNLHSNRGFAISSRIYGKKCDKIVSTNKLIRRVNLEKKKLFLDFPSFNTHLSESDAVAECVRFQTNGTIFGLDIRKANDVSLKQHDIGKHFLEISGLEKYTLKIVSKLHNWENRPRGGIRYFPHQIS